MKISEFLLKENEYNCIVDQEARFFHVDSFCITLLPDKEATLTKISRFFNVSYESVTKFLTLEDILQMRKSIQPRVGIFAHYMDNDNEFQPIRKLAKACRAKNVISILDVSKSIQKIAPALFPMDIVLCERENYCVLILNESYLKDSYGLMLRKQLVDESLLLK
ncbi:MAG: hypothetical protein LBH92_01145 [Bacteroidales bacterium]|jgi:hypothetical protein|nr:hypothetical protein [Bacteroidales bacterium]